MNDNKIKVLYLGYAVPQSDSKKYSGISIAGNKMQLNILKRLYDNQDILLDVITIPPISGFPHDNKIFVETKKVPLFKNNFALEIGFINLPVIKQVWQTISMYIQAKKLINENKDTLLFSFNLFPQIGLPFTWLKKKYKLKNLCLLADLPIDDNYNRSGLSKLLRLCFDKLTLDSIRECDNFIVLNKYVENSYISGKRHIVIEGGVDLSEYVINEIPNLREKKNILYSGSLSEYSGIKSIVDAFDLIENSDVELHIYGSGTLKEYIEEKSKLNPKVKYFGVVSNTDIKILQSNAWILVNPRPANDPISKVTFPSKIFEYMMSGTPILSTKLNGLSEDYLRNMFIIEDENPKHIAGRIEQLSKMDSNQMKTKAESARDFVITKKNWDNQADKIYHFINSIAKNS